MRDWDEQLDVKHVVQSMQYLRRNKIFREVFSSNYQVEVYEDDNSYYIQLMFVHDNLWQFPKENKEYNEIDHWRKSYSDIFC